MLVVYWKYFELLNCFTLRNKVCGKFYCASSSVNPPPMASSFLTVFTSAANSDCFVIIPNRYFEGKDNTPNGFSCGNSKVSLSFASLLHMI